MKERFYCLTSLFAFSSFFGKTTVPIRMPKYPQIFKVVLAVNKPQQDCNITK